MWKRKKFWSWVLASMLLCVHFSDHVAACALLAIYNVAHRGMQAHANKGDSWEWRPKFRNQGHFCCANWRLLLVLKKKNKWRAKTDGSATLCLCPWSVTSVVPARFHFPPPVFRPKCWLSGCAGFTWRLPCLLWQRRQTADSFDRWLWNGARFFCCDSVLL